MQKNEYCVKDSSLTFILAIVVPNLLAILLILVAGSFTSLEKFQASTAFKVISTIITQIGFIITFFIIKKTSKVSFKAIKMQKLNFKSILIIVLVAFVCLFLITPLMNVYDSFLISLGIKEQQLSLGLDTPLKLIFLIFALGILAPICEEFIFRGIIFSGLKEKGIKNAVLISSLMFMLMHLSLHQTFYQFILGIILALLYYFTQNIFAPILIHFINNVSILLINYFSPSFFEYRFLTSNYIILAVVLFLVGVFFIYHLLLWLRKTNIEKINNAKKEIEVNVKKENNNQKLKPKYLIISLTFGILMWIITVVSSI